MTRFAPNARRTRKRNWWRSGMAKSRIGKTKSQESRREPPRLSPATRRQTCIDWTKNEAEPRICSHQRSFDDRQRQGEKCASEAADLFAVLQGLPSPSLSSADGV